MARSSWRSDLDLAALRARAGVGRGRRRAAAPQATGPSLHPWAPLALIEQHEASAAAGGVSLVARGKTSTAGFLPRYKRAGGRWQDLPEAWIRKREAFVARHLAQALDNREQLWSPHGGYSRRGLALLMWAYDPRKAR